MTCGGLRPVAAPIDTAKKDVEAGHVGDCGGQGLPALLGRREGAADERSERG